VRSVSLRGQALAGETVFATMSRLAKELDAVNLGQGFPETPGPVIAIEAAVRALRAGHNQYAPAGGVPVLRQRVAQLWEPRLGRELDPLANVTVTVGATEAIAAACLAWLEPGDEVIVFEPSYDAYLWAARLAGARPIAVPLVFGETLAVDADRLASSITPRTKAIIVNSPHNPSGGLLGEADLKAIAALALEHDLRVLADEVYEYLVYEGEHRSIATVEGMAERTVVVSSAAKTFGVTGWKVGWAIGDAARVAELRAVAQYLTYAGATPLQLAVAEALAGIEQIVPLVREPLRRQRDLLAAGLAGLGFSLIPSHAGYFLLSDLGPLQAATSHEASQLLAHSARVVTIPIEPFYVDPARAPRLLRWSFARGPETLREAIARTRRVLERGLRSRGPSSPLLS